VKKLVSLTFLLACSPLALATSACAADITSGASASQTAPTTGVTKAGQGSATKPLGPITHQVDLYIPGSASLKLSGTFLVRVRTPKGKPLTSPHLVVGLCRGSRQKRDHGADALCVPQGLLSSRGRTNAHNTFHSQGGRGPRRDGAERGPASHPREGSEVGASDGATSSRARAVRARAGLRSFDHVMFAPSLE
jgi:hypothetical protein